MSVSSRPRLSFLPWVEGVARQIGDPVQRLRFLRVAAPCVPTRRVPAHRRLRAMMFPAAIAAVVFLILAVAAVSLSFVKARTAPPSQPHKTSAPSR